MTVRKRVWLNQGIVSACALGIAAMAVWIALRSSKDLSWTAAANRFQIAATNLLLASNTLDRNFDDYLTHDGRIADVRTALDSFIQSRAELDAAYRADAEVSAGDLESDVSREKQSIEQLEANCDRLLSGSRQIFALGESGKMDAARSSFEDRIAAHISDINDLAGSIIKKEGEEINDRQEALVDQAHTFAWCIAGGSALLVAAVLFGAMTLSPISNSVIRKINSLVDATRAISRGEFDHRIDWTGGDELGTLAGQFNEMASQLAHQRKELENVQRQLSEGSRKSGMAEIATSVLHNVGNALNSAGVAASISMDQLRKSKAADLVPAVQMLNEHADELPTFLGENDRGRQLAIYLARLSECLTNEQLAMSSELSSLVQSLEHVKQIVSKQQQYARYAGVSEAVKVADLVEDAMKLDGNWSDASRIRVEKIFDAIEPITVDRHRLMEILLNLLSNARHAMQCLPPRERRLRVLTKADDGFVQITIEDNGSGIAPENLDRIFCYGFTTKPDGHGFGLHGATHAARALGGELQVQSDGVGRGAAFTVLVPRQHQEAIP